MPESTSAPLLLCENTGHQQSAMLRGFLQTQNLKGLHHELQSPQNRGEEISVALCSTLFMILLHYTVAVWMK